MIDVEQHGSVKVIRLARSLLGRPLYWTAAYWVDGLLIDAGPACTARELVQVLGQVPVQQIAITHSHEDHIGGLALLRQRYPDVPIYASRHALSTIEDPARLKLQRYRRLVWGTPSPVRGVQSLDEIADEIRTPEFTLRVIETPGHSRDHVSFFEPRFRWLFCGDAFIGGRDIAWTPEFDMFSIVSSLRTMASLRPERLYPGSGHVRRTPLADLHGKIGDLIQLANEVLKLESSGYSVHEMVEMLFRGEPRIHWWTFGHFSAAHLVEACRTYNALVTPGDLASLAPRDRRGRTDDLADSSSTNRSTDPGDWRR
ncbi:MAG: MBL fold metallo-hydrolase [Caldilineaceae bacterium]|nr:MBL fold metallo-hydrolase [Caldilineaceae bacterium]